MVSVFFDFSEGRGDGDFSNSFLANERKIRRSNFSVNKCKVTRKALGAVLLLRVEIIFFLINLKNVK
jgi:hypothetical protein